MYGNKPFLADIMISVRRIYENGQITLLEKIFHTKKANVSEKMTKTIDQFFLQDTYSGLFGEERK